ncbi:hypothetical protein QBC34DRAFT_493434 [Podospora aff. communis PSN243]|uniref:Pectate lyase superfamily protein domain-containing protein n=1 Tax=Podospora aff. communis PSN243 TaxID=3040156 RepID=A0AAV9GWI1_9PEZI|nr:hypothetical protein QBC34DRAFT_493434 [Podospora aff. communis PSN243]
MLLPFRFWQRKTCGIKNQLWALMLLLSVLVLAIVPPVIVRVRAQSPLPLGFQWADVQTPRGDRLPDFSYCGYRAFQQPLPSNQTQPAVALERKSGDQTRRIQDALDEVAARGGGVVALGPGEFAVSAKGLTLASGVGLRGAGPSLTRLKFDELGDVPAISLGNGTSIPSVLPFHTAGITDGYVPIGSSRVTVDNVDGFEPGQRVFVQRQVTEAWVRANGMGDLVLYGEQQTWLKPGTVVRQPRTIKSVDGNEVILDIPLTDALDTNSGLMQPSLVAFDPPPISAEMGIEDLSITLSPSCSGASLNTRCDSPAISFTPWSSDSWARNLELTGFNFYIETQYNSSRITVQDVVMTRDADAKDAGNTNRALPADILVQGTQLLVADCSQQGLETAASFAVMTGSLAPGPNAVVRFAVPSESQLIVPHQRWAHGFLVEDTDAQVRFINRATNGTGHGWSINAGVGWNLRGKTLVQSPPLGVNWCIGCSGLIDDRSNGSFLEQGREVMPKSLFGAQLEQRTDLLTLGRLPRN